MIGMGRQLILVLFETVQNGLKPPLGVIFENVQQFEFVPLYSDWNRFHIKNTAYNQLFH